MVQNIQGWKGLSVDKRLIAELKGLSEELSIRCLI